MAKWHLCETCNRYDVNNLDMGCKVMLKFVSQPGVYLDDLPKSVIGCQKMIDEGRAKTKERINKILNDEI